MRIYGKDKVLEPKEFYARMRAGEIPTTMATNPEDSKELFEARLKEGYDIIHIGFSSGLSSSCQNSAIAANELMEEYEGIYYYHRYCCRLTSSIL